LNIKFLNHLIQQNAGNPQILPLQGEMEASLAQQDHLSKNAIISTFSSFWIQSLKSRTTSACKCCN